MTESEESQTRIHVLELRSAGEDATHYLLILTLCEIARQLMRLANAYIANCEVKPSGEFGKNDE